MDNARRGVKLIIAGSRTIPPSCYPLIARSIRKPRIVSEVVSGEARGADRLGELWAKRNGVPVAHFPALWERYGRFAGKMRNIQMADYADCLLAIWDGKSPGTAHMIAEMKRRGKPVKVVTAESN